VTTIPGGLKKRSSLRGVFERMRLAFSRFASLPRARRRSILIGGVVAAGISFIVGLILITTLELGVGKSLSCWVWDECSVESSAEASESAGASSTLPSILGGGQRAGSSSTPQEEEASPSNPQEEEGPSNLQQQPDYPPGTPKAPSQAPPPAPAPPANPSAQEEPAQQQGPSGVPEKEYQQQSLPNGAPADQQQPPGSGTPEDQ
jgi:hypothetical protein